MTQTSWPFENVDTSETQFSQWARNIGEGVKGSSGGTELKPYGDSSGMQVKVPAGYAMVRGHYYGSTAIETLVVTVAHATFARIDSVVLELDPSANVILLKVVAGTPAAVPVAPTLTQTDAGIYQQLLGTVAVAAATTSITVGNVTDARSFLGGSYVTPAGVQTLTNKTLTSPVVNTPTISSPSFTGSAQELVTIVATGFAGYTYNAVTQAVVYVTANSTANGTLNIRGDGATTLNSFMSVGEAITVVLAITNNATAYYPTAYQIDGVAITPKWAGPAPTAGNASAVDSYTLTVIKTAATPSYTLLASQTKFA